MIGQLDRIGHKANMAKDKIELTTVKIDKLAKEVDKTNNELKS